MKKHFRLSREFIIVLLFVLALLTPGFYRNQWLAAGRKWFYDWRKIQEHMVIARLVESRQSGILAYGALLGSGSLSTLNASLGTLEEEYQAYHENGRFQSYIPYTSNPGLQGVLFGLFAQIADLPPGLNLRLFHGVTSLLTALVLGLFVYWVFHELGWLAGIATLLFIAASEWMTLFGGNIYWNLWGFYLPLVAASFYLRLTSVSENYNQALLIVILAVSMLIKCLFTGFEYITTALAMPLFPFVFYATRDAWGWSTFWLRLIKSSVGLLAGVAGGLLTLIVQLMQVKAGFKEAITTILNALGKRTLGDSTQSLPEVQSLSTDLAPVLMQYISGRAVLLSQVLHIQSISLEISYLALFIIFMSLTLLLLVLGRSKVDSNSRASSAALIVTTWSSALAPLSWFVFFKAHSLIHIQLNYIVWQMPFTLYGFALCGYTIGMMTSHLRIKNPFKRPSNSPYAERPEGFFRKPY